MRRERAYAKVNLVLEVGARRPDGLHELASLFASLELHDLVTLESAARDEVVCPGVEGPNLAGAAVKLFRSRVASDLPPLRVTIDKAIPVAAGLAGGSADAAAALRGANALAGAPADAAALRLLASELGSDVPSQVEPAHALVGGTGERVERVSLPPMALLLLPQEEGLQTGAVYAEADRLGTTRARVDVEALRVLVGLAPRALAPHLVNDLEPAALALRPELARALEELRAAGALVARITGSGPTAYGLWENAAGAERAAAGLPGALVTRTRRP